MTARDTRLYGLIAGIHYLSRSLVCHLLDRDSIVRVVLMVMTTEERAIQENCQFEQQSYLPSNLLGIHPKIQRIHGEGVNNIHVQF